MTNEAFQHLMLDKLTALDQKITDEIADVKDNIVGLKDDISNVKDDISKLPTREDLNQVIREQQKDVLSILSLVNIKIERVETKIDILQTRCFEQETDIQLLKKVK